MEIQRYHWVGLASGVPLFSGAWLSAYYNNVWLGATGILVAAAGIYMANHVERRSDRTQHMLRGAVAGALAAVVARLLGAVAMLIASVSQTTSYDGLGDTLRVVLAGDWVASVVLVILAAVVGAVIASFEPEARGNKQ